MDQLPSVETEELFSFYSEEGITSALSEINNLYGESQKLESQLPYHNKDHTEYEITYTEWILRAIQDVIPEAISERDIQLARFAAAYHDLVQFNQSEEIQENGYTVVRRKKYILANEQASFTRARAFAQNVNHEEGIEIFTKQDLRLVEESIMATVYGWNGVYRTVIQPNLVPSTSHIARAVALADINSSGLIPEDTIKNAIRTFQEENWDFWIATENPENLSEDQLELFKQRIFTWIHSQINFIRGRKILIKDEVTGFPPMAISTVLNLFDGYDRSIEILKTFETELRGLSTKDVIKNFMAKSF